MYASARLARDGLDAVSQVPRDAQRYVRIDGVASQNEPAHNTVDRNELVRVIYVHRLRRHQK